MRDMSLWKKMLMGYAIVIVLPFTLFITALAAGYLTRVNDMYLNNEQRNMQREYGALAERLSLLKSYHLLFQNDQSVIKYMSGRYFSIGEEIEELLTDIRPNFSFISCSGQNVDDVTVYCLQKPLVPLTRQMVYRPEAYELVNSLDSGGRWFFSPDEKGGLTLKCQVPLYAKDYSRRLGMFELTVSAYVYKNGTCGSRYFYACGGWYHIADGALVSVSPGEDPLLDAYLFSGNAGNAGNGILVNRMPLAELDSELLSITVKKDWADIAGFGIQALVIAVLFVILSAFYYLIISSYTKRLLIFSKYISGTNHSLPEEYGGDRAKDEIGLLIQAYNGMIRRIRELVSDLNIAELKKREADYFALQAQMRPHFLYNSLETARMMADSNGDEEVGDFLFNLGGFIRYSFASARKAVSLETELEIVGKYLGLYKASMGDRLAFTLDKQSDVSGVECPPFIVQPLVENSLHHAFDDKRKQLSIRVTAFKTDEKTVVTVEDDGGGIPPEKMAGLLSPDFPPEKLSVRGNGLGIRNTGKRLNDYFQGKVDFEIESALGRGTACTITIWNCA